MKPTLQLILSILMVAIAINFVTTVEVDYYYNVIHREVFITKAVIFCILGVILTYSTYK